MQTEKDQKLEEVRSILQRLQRISTDSEEDLSEDEGFSASQSRHTAARQMAHPAGEARASQPDVTHAGAAEASRAVGGNGKLLVLAGLSVACVGGIVFFWPAPLAEPDTALQSTAGNSSITLARTDAKLPDNPAPSDPGSEKTVNIPQTEVQPLPPPDPDAERISQAEQLMSAGKVTDARQLLQDDLAERVAEASLMLARSYDPNALRLIQGANADADIAEAERWYRRWYELAARNGLTMDPERLNRIIQAMR